MTYFTEKITIGLENIFGKGPVDNLHLIIVHDFLHGTYSNEQKKKIKMKKQQVKIEGKNGMNNDDDDSVRGSEGGAALSYLYNVIQDPCEIINLIDTDEAIEIIAKINAEINRIRSDPKLPQLQPMGTIVDLTDVWSKTHVKGDCTMNPHLTVKECRFTHPWVQNVSDRY